VKDTLIAVLNSRHFTDEDLMPFARMLAAGKTVAFPTETVYGLGADATSPAALEAIFKAKGRPSDNPLIVHVAEVEQIRELTEEITPLAQLLIEHFWPGPLTIILKKSDKVPDMVTAGLNTVALRMPSHPLARRLIALAGVPVAAPSANRSGRPSPTRGSHVITDLMGRVDAIIDGGLCEVGLESTVVDATGTVPVILRPGGITREMLEAVIRGVELDPSLLSETILSASSTPRSPGMKYTHYAPKAKMVIAGAKTDNAVAVSPEETAKMLLTLWKRHLGSEKAIGILCTEETASALRQLLLHESPPDARKRPSVKSLGSSEQPDVMAAALFQRLREFDGEPVTLILAQRIPETAMGFALMNRLMKAAGYRQETVDKG
jgi:L-threonylcarbamoyladenylate synthase